MVNVAEPVPPAGSEKSCTVNSPSARAETGVPSACSVNAPKLLPKSRRSFRAPPNATSGESEVRLTVTVMVSPSITRSVVVERANSGIGGGSSSSCTVTCTDEGVPTVYWTSSMGAVSNVKVTVPFGSSVSSPEVLKGSVASAASRPQMTSCVLVASDKPNALPPETAMRTVQRKSASADRVIVIEMPSPSVTVAVDVPIVNVSLWANACTPKTVASAPASKAGTVRLRSLIARPGPATGAVPPGGERRLLPENAGGGGESREGGGSIVGPKRPSDACMPSRSRGAPVCHRRARLFFVDRARGDVAAWAPWAGGVFPPATGPCVSSRVRKP